MGSSQLGSPSNASYSSSAAVSEEPPAAAVPASEEEGTSAWAGQAVPGWVKGLAFCAFTAPEVLRLAERLQRFLGPLACRTVSPDQLFSHAPPRQGELLLRPLRHTSDPSLAWLHELRRQGLHAPVLFIRSGLDFIPMLPLESLGAVDFLPFDDASDFDLWRSLALLKRAYQRERALLDLTGELESAQNELVRRRDEVGYLTLSLAGREIDEELLGDRIEEKAIQQVRQHVQRSERFNTPLTAHMIGIDGMEEIKKLYGSGFAAFLLVQVAYRLKRTLGGSDALWRSGEHGFLLLSQETSLDAIRAHARRLRSAVACAPLEHAGHTLTPSISIGAARFREEMTTSGELIDVAKMALRTAQTQGKGRMAIV